jgi:hypothetical protein
MFKKLFSISLLAFAFLFIAGSAQAQLNFYNGSPCAIQVKAAAYFGGNPCLAPSCASAVVNVPPGGFATIPVPPCLGVSPIPSYRAVKFAMFPGITAAADVCGANPVNFIDCQGNPRILNIVSPSFAGIF